MDVYISHEDKHIEQQALDEEYRENGLPILSSTIPTDKEVIEYNDAFNRNLDVYGDVTTLYLPAKLSNVLGVYLNDIPSHLFITGLKNTPENLIIHVELMDLEDNPNEIPTATSMDWGQS